MKTPMDMIAIYQFIGDGLPPFEDIDTSEMDAEDVDMLRDAHSVLLEASTTAAQVFINVCV